jgi:dipeptidyl aminopeptidase/acylaminoacyl peptidase
VGQENPAKRMTPELLWKLGRLGEAVPSPDGTQIAFTVRRYELAEDKGSSNLFIMNVADDTKVVALEKWPSIGSIDWIDNESGSHLFFEGINPDDAVSSNQAWSMDTKNHDLKQVTSIEGGISNFKVAPTGGKIAFTLDIKLDQKPNEIYADLPKADARIIDQLMYRHWNAWHDYRYSHLHVCVLGEDGVAETPVDLMEGRKADCPVPPFGGTEQFSWSPDGTEIAFTMKDVDKWEESTNSDVFVIAADGSGEPTNISKDGLGYDNNPVYSPNGRLIAYSSMERAGFEADRNRIMVYNRKRETAKEITKGLDQNANGPVWKSDSKSLIFDSERDGTTQLFEITLKGQTLKQLTEGWFNWHFFGELKTADAANETLIVSRTNMLRPAEIYSLDNKKGTKLTDINDAIYANLELPTIEQRFVEATDGKSIQCWVINPPGFDPKSDIKWPMLTYCQGGPQGQIGQWFSYRWNFHLMAANGYVVVAPNRRGLPGFGREWNDQISGDWGGQAMKDILSATDAMTAEKFIDKEHVAAIGASFGGYTVYWLMGNSADRFCSMIAHCGVFNLESMYGATEELFFVNWDLGGPYWKNDEVLSKYQKFSPHRFVKEWTTPLLVIHGQKDFRVPVTQGMEAFTAAQVQDVPSRFLYFPEEGHWVMRPQNGVLWHRIFFDWLNRYCKDGK